MNKWIILAAIVAVAACRPDRPRTGGALYQGAPSDLYRSYYLRVEIDATPICAIEGVAHAFVFGGYELNVKRGQAFEWDEIEPAILAELRKQGALEE